ncbi:carbohydrate kinase family protein [Micromonospora sp. NPDC006766]|uniref:carbohydrate kinase family protein n=1 Tax=Micromonospora sp. NPDC006766 TaxID=3154778 RepID=UPI0033FB3FA7
MPQHIVGLAPSIVDIAARLPADTWRHCLALVGAQPGEWQRIDVKVASSLLAVILGADVNDVLRQGDRALSPDLAIRPGSTVANALAAMPARSGLRRTFVSTVGVHGDVLDPLSGFFRTSIEAVGIEHHVVPVVGDNPMVFVLSSHDQAERTLAMFPGVADELSHVDLDILSPTLVLVDAYNLGSHAFGRYLDRLIESKRYPVLMSLGNHTILTGDRARRVRSYIGTGCLTALCGNVQEYGALYPEVGQGDEHVERLLDQVAVTVPYALVTMGAGGMAATWEGHQTRVSAIPVRRRQIVNTSGAGDAAAGMFAAGIVSGDAPEETLRRAAVSAMHTLRRL